MIRTTGFRVISRLIWLKILWESDWCLMSFIEKHKIIAIILQFIPLFLIEKTDRIFKINSPSVERSSQANCLCVSYAVCCALGSHTSIDRWELFSEHNECRHFRDAILSGITYVSYFDKHYVQIVRFVVNVFQFVKNFFAIVTILFIWTSHQEIYEIDFVL